MRKYTRTLVLAAILIAGAAATSLHAQDTQQSPGSMMDHRGMMGRDGAKSEGGMSGMMNMMRQMSQHMRQMSQMMDHCSHMMGDSGQGNRPNDQWRDRAPAAPDKKG